MVKGGKIYILVTAKGRADEGFDLISEYRPDREPSGIEETVV